MNSIWKYPIRIVDEQAIPMPRGAEILCVQVQGDGPFLWARVDPEAPELMRKIITHGTGHEVSETTGRYIGTYQLDGGALVFHVFEPADMRPNYK